MGEPIGNIQCLDPRPVIQHNALWQDGSLRTSMKIHFSYHENPQIFLDIHGLNPHPRMRGPCGPQRDSPGTYAVIIGIPEPRVYLIISFKQRCFVFGVRADPAPCKFVSFFL